MKQIVWTDEFSVGIESLDNQHKQIIGFINRLAEDKDVSSRSKTLHEILYEMMQYSLEHFMHEEKLLIETGYQDLINHKDLHARYIEKYSDLSMAAMKSSSDSLTSELLEFLVLWWENHILEEDMKCKTFLTDQMRATLGK